jgi:hypothetical protein
MIDAACQPTVVWFLLQVVDKYQTAMGEGWGIGDCILGHMFFY